jgi:DNA invertase Pin-like site-specific DNA recombinase
MKKGQAALTSPTLTALRAARGTGRRRNRKTAEGGVVGYLRCSHEESVTSGLGLDAQEAAIRSECERRGLELVAVFRDEGVSGSVPPDLRPGLSKAICALDAGQASILMVSKVDRLGRSFADLALLTPLAQKNGWGIIALNSPLDASTPMGAAMAGMMALFAQLERDLVRERTRDALAVKKAQGVQLGRVSGVPSRLVRQMVRQYQAGKGWSQIARELNEKGTPTAQGGKQWYPSTVRAVVLGALGTSPEAAAPAA